MICIHGLVYLQDRWDSIPAEDFWFWPSVADVDAGLNALNRCSLAIGLINFGIKKRG